MFAPANVAHFELKIPTVRNDLKVLAFDGTEAIQRLCAEDGVAWDHQPSPDGHRLVFTDHQNVLSKRGDPPYQQGSGIQALKQQGGAAHA